MRTLLCLLLLAVPLTGAIRAPVALASDGWCDTDPILVVYTPAGRLVPVYVTVGARSLLFSPDTLLGSVVLGYSAVASSDGKGTQVTAVVRVPKPLLAAPFEIRSLVSSGAFGTGTLYAQDHGVSGEPMTMVFELPYP